MLLIAICDEVKDINGNSTTEELGIVTKRQAKKAKTRWQRMLGPGWKIISK